MQFNVVLSHVYSKRRYFSVGVAGRLEGGVSRFVSGDRITELEFLGRTLTAELNSSNLSHARKTIILAVFISGRPLRPSRVSRHVRIPERALASILSTLRESLLLFETSRPDSHEHGVLRLASGNSRITFGVFRELEGCRRDLLSVLSRRRISFLSEVREGLYSHVVRLSGVG